MPNSTGHTRQSETDDALRRLARALADRIPFVSDEIRFASIDEATAADIDVMESRWTAQRALAVELAQAADFDVSALASACIELPEVGRLPDWAQLLVAARYFAEGRPCRTGVRHFAEGRRGARLRLVPNVDADV